MNTSLLPVADRLCRTRTDQNPTMIRPALFRDYGHTFALLRGPGDAGLPKKVLYQ